MRQLFRRTISQARPQTSRNLPRDSERKTCSGEESATLRPFLACLLVFSLTGLLSQRTLQAEQGATPERSPNIVYILADDIGIGDIQASNPDCKIPTPCLNALASEGMTFTDAHSSSAVCTPSRYSILTGRYCWRSPLKSGVLYGFSGPLIEPSRPTVATFLKQHGYSTAAIGKWHLGMDWAVKTGETTSPEKNGWVVDYEHEIGNGPTSCGFEQFFGISASLDMPPFLFIKNDRPTAVPTVEKKWGRKGPADAAFEAVDVLSTLEHAAVADIKSRAGQNRPFFLYLPLTSPHTPIVPSPEWQNKSELGSYGDFVMQTDAVVGSVLHALAEANLAQNTLVIFTSDNGCSPAAGYPALAKHGHHPSGPYRGHKADLFEGGHRIPFFVRWPGHVRPGSVSHQTICQTDLFATLAEILKAELPVEAAVDSVSLLPILNGDADQPVREAIVHHSINGSFAIRQGPWKLLLCPDSGGWSEPRPGRKNASTLPPRQLYNLENDIAEQRNVIDQYPQVAEQLVQLLEKYVADGRSTPGAPQPNSGNIPLYK